MKRVFLPEIIKGGRLRSIDALRGAAAMGVVLYHMVGPKPQAAAGSAWRWLSLPFMHALSFGYVGVFLFFVISGFCIHLQWAKSAAIGREPEIDFAAFWKRRLLRLYPPYLIALVLYLSIAALTSEVQFNLFYLWDTGLHLLMLHNLDPRTSYSINGVFWTLAIEEQLYLAYFLLLFMRRRWGWGSALVVCAVARIAWLALGESLKQGFGIEIPVTEAAASHWFTWALGALGVEAAMGVTRLPGWCRNLWVGGAALAYAVVLSYVSPRYDDNFFLHHGLWLTLHPAWGLGFFILVNRAVCAENGWRERGRMPWTVTRLAAIGLFSYSLYLTHELVLMETWRVSDFPLLNSLPLPTALFSVIIMTPLTLAGAWLFFLLCERPFLSRPKVARSKYEVGRMKDERIAIQLE
jgi:peptidoglycan/LPS O-acetylase OafA/YrhL